MQPPQTAPKKEPFDPITFGIQILFPLVFFGFPLAFVVLIFTTDLNQSLGEQLGVNLPYADNLIVYDAICSSSGNRPQMNITFWSREAAPIVLLYAEKRESPRLNFPAGIQTLEVTLFYTRTCPDHITLKDASRGIMAGAAVEVIEE